MRIDELIAVLAALQVKGFHHVEFPSGLVLHSEQWGIKYIYEQQAQAAAMGVAHAV